MDLTIALLKVIGFNGPNSAPWYTCAALVTCGRVFYGFLKKCMGILSFVLFPKKLPPSAPTLSP